MPEDLLEEPEPDRGARGKCHLWVLDHDKWEPLLVGIHMSRDCSWHGCYAPGGVG